MFKKYRSQDSFTKQVIEPVILSVVRDIPSSYTPVEFRGDKRGEAQSAMLNAALEPYGVEVNLQNITFTDVLLRMLK